MKEKEVERIRSFYRNAGLSDSVVQEYLDYSVTLLERDLPVIFDFEHLSLLLGVKKSFLASAIRAPERHYRHFNIQKRDGSQRELSVPMPTLKTCQRWILDNILYRNKVHNAAYGFVKGRSILKNARVHAGSSKAFVYDLKDYFPSIGAGRVNTIFSALGYSKQVSYLLTSLVTLDGALPQGAPTSPCLSNISSNLMDARLSGYAMKNGMMYTRYADDLVFSGGEDCKINNALIRIVINENGHSINPNKERRYISRMVVTGLNIQDGRISVPKSYKRRVAQECYYIMKYGLLSHMKKKEIKKIKYHLTVLGRLEYIRSIESDEKWDKLYARMCEYFENIRNQSEL